GGLHGAAPADDSALADGEPHRAALVAVGPGPGTPGGLDPPYVEPARGLGTGRPGHQPELAGLLLAPDPHLQAERGHLARGDLVDPGPTHLEPFAIAAQHHVAGRDLATVAHHHVDRGGHAPDQLE